MTETEHNGVVAVEAADELIKIGGREYRRFIPYPEEVEDGTLRCICCGQIDDEPYHDDEVCQKIQRGEMGQ